MEAERQKTGPVSPMRPLPLTPSFAHVSPRDHLAWKTDFVLSPPGRGPSERADGLYEAAPKFAARTRTMFKLDSAMSVDADVPRAAKQNRSSDQSPRHKRLQLSEMGQKLPVLKSSPRQTVRRAHARPNPPKLFARASNHTAGLVS